jgi:glucokinase
VIGVGLDVGGTKVLGVAVDEEGSVLAEQRRPTAADGPGLLDELAALYLELSESALAVSGRSGSGPHDDGAAPLGVGVPGLVDANGTLVFAANLPGAAGTDFRAGLRSRLQDRCGAVQVDNDATCAAAGECAYGAGRGRSDVLFVTLGTGIGGGIVAGGRLVRGSGNFAGEIGHTVIDPHGPPCGCGRRGCWERYASGSGLGRIARDAALAGRAGRVVAISGGDADSVRGEHVVRAVSEGDEEANAILEEFAWWLALGLANLANILDPRVVVIGGGLVRAGEPLLAAVRAALLEQVEGAAVRPEIDLVPAALGDRGGAIGAAVTGFEAAGSRVIGP